MQIIALENNMKTPQYFGGYCGVLNIGMTVIVALYILIGFFGYLKYGAEAGGSVTFNLPSDEVWVSFVSRFLFDNIIIWISREYFLFLQHGTKYQNNVRHSHFYHARPARIRSSWNYLEHLSRSEDTEEKDFLGVRLSNYYHFGHV